MVCILCSKDTFEELVYNDLPLLRCLSCGLIRRRTFDLSPGYYEHADPGSDPHRIDARRRNAEDRVRLIDRHVLKGNLCDIGAGDGAFLSAWHRSGGTGVGIEPSKKATETAISMGVDIVGDTLIDFPAYAAANPVAVVTLFHVIEHVENPRASLETVFRGLSSGSILVLETPNIDSFVLRQKGFRDNLINPEHLYYFNSTTLRLLVEKAGYTFVAMGKRDFDIDRLPISESLSRLGLRGWSLAGSAAVMQTYTAGSVGQVHEPESSAHWRTVPRFVLSRAVRLSRRLNYIWLIARR